MIQVKKLEKSYNNVNHLHILQNLNLTVEEGEFLGIMGASGSGKSTFLRILGGLETFLDGEAAVCGENLQTMKEPEKEVYRQKVVSYIFQDYNLLSGLTVKENIILPSTMGNVEEKKLEQDYAAITQKLGIDAYENRFPDEISGGEQQRAAIARAVLKHSRVLLADEPTGSLDMHTARNVLELFEEINRDYHVTVVMVTHDVFSASFCNRIIFLKDGKFTNEIEKSGFQQDFYKMIQKEMREMDGIF